MIRAETVAVGEGGVWIPGGRGVLHLDPESGQLLEEIRESTCSSGVGVTKVVVGAGSVWGLDGCGVLKVNPATDEIADRGLFISAPGPFGVRVRDLALGAGSFYVLEAGSVHRFDPFRHREIGATEASNDANEMAVGLDGVWITDIFQSTLARFDPRTLKEIGVYELPVTPDAMDIGFGSVWILNRSAGTVTEIDPVSGAAGEARRVGEQPQDLDTGLGSIWVANHGDGTVSRVDPATGNVDTIKIGGPPSALAVDEERGIVWVVVISCLNPNEC